MSLRVRLTFLYSGVLALTMLAFGVSVYFFMAHNLTAEADRAIADVAADVIRSTKISGSFSTPQLQVALPDIDVFANPNTYLQVVNRIGEVVAQSDNLGVQSIPVSAETLRQSIGNEGFFVTVMSGTQRLRVYNRPLYLEGGVIGMLQVGRTMGPSEEALERLRLLLFFGGGITLVLAGTLGWLLAGAALRPIDRITQTASAIQQGRDLSRRISFSGAPFGEVGRLVATLNQMLERLQNAYVSLEQAEATQRRFVSDASHELRTPLTTIRGNVELLKKMGDADPQTRAEALDDIDGEVVRMTRLVSDLLVLARADARLKLREEKVSLAPLLHEVARRGSFLSNGVVFSAGDFSLLGDSKVTGDADYLKQLLIILVENAFNYTSPRGEVRLEAKINQPFVELSVIDSGIGIGGDDLINIFERFYRSDQARSHDGTGLGLAIAKWIAEHHGGTISVESKLGEGSKFTVHLPLN